MKMKFNQLKLEDYSFKLYRSIQCELALQKQKPIFVIRFDNTNNSRFILIKQSEHGEKLIPSRCFTIPADSVCLFASWIAYDFPNVDIKVINLEGEYNGKES